MVKWRRRGRIVKRNDGTAVQIDSRHTESQATPIWISKRTRTVLLVCSLAALVLLICYSPSVPIMLLGGFALALIISFPVRALSRFMPRGWAILASLLALVGVATLALVVLVTILIAELVSFISYVPEYATGAEQLLRRGLLEPLAERGLLPGTPEEFMTNLSQDLLNRAQSIAQQLLGGLMGFISGTFSLVLTLLGVLFVAIYLLLAPKRTKHKGTLPAGNASPLPARCPRPLGRLRLLALALPSGVGTRGFYSRRAFGYRALLSRRPLRHPARNVGLDHLHHPLPGGLSRGDPRCHPGPLRVADHGASHCPCFPLDPAAGRQHPDAPNTGTDPADPLYPDLPSRHRRRRDCGPTRRRLRRADPGRAKGTLRLLPRSPSHQDPIA